MTACMNAACKNACWVYSSGFGPEVSKQGARLFNTTIFQLLAAVIRKGSHKRLSEDSWDLGVQAIRNQSQKLDARN